MIYSEVFLHVCHIILFEDCLTHFIVFHFCSNETLKRHLPVSGEEGLQELWKIARRFEDKIFTGATSQVHL